MSEKTINPDCPCKANCVRHGDCEACQANHAGGKTSCQKLKEKEQKE
ncbi:MAG: hypothetical protein LBD16_08040 [Oscillospiraceae bacterium]|jgi:hypothetical protein|nr:hypothetical protein [Oscillospiraceae bacterium]